ncbi:MAG TPA: nickel pincer cofactor biosynthesis protein LarB [Acidobacteriota bacterium]|nr:nickel pincer cofactor biosynthesis protein LarB [Acidobacteriota bacterium]HQG90839.1 nickel pincer cofactor biosynthesis protein LarB [Acidobacteriota bacterium]HQK86615.1 nickel pincer cofactor biosynthesis protein LarB [Acidobacteriota bacterium]
MNEQELRRLLESLQRGEIPVEGALERLRHLPFEDLGFARVDHHRALRHGFPEVIFGRGKTVAEVTAIAERIIDRTANLLITHATPEMFEALSARFDGLTHHARARCVTRCTDATDRGRGTILIITAGTADLPVAEEAMVTAQIMGNRVELVADVGVAGIHRLLSVREQIAAASVVVAVAGMEGALPSAVGGLASCPVIAVPTSIGYGVSFGGVAALLGMLNSCASNVAVVNIDNGFGAGYVAALANRR